MHKSVCSRLSKPNPLLIKRLCEACCIFSIFASSFQNRNVSHSECNNATGFLQINIVLPPCHCHGFSKGIRIRPLDGAVVKSTLLCKK